MRTTTHRPTKSVGTIDKPFSEGFLSEPGRFVGRKGFVGKLSYVVSYDMVLYDICLWFCERVARKRDFAIYCTLGICVLSHDSVMLIVGYLLDPSVN